VALPEHLVSTLQHPKNENAQNVHTWHGSKTEVSLYLDATNRHTESICSPILNPADVNADTQYILSM
jgi:hypothetical protein